MSAVNLGATGQIFLFLITVKIRNSTPSGPSTGAETTNPLISDRINIGAYMCEEFSPGNLSYYVRGQMDLKTIRIDRFSAFNLMRRSLIKKLILLKYVVRLVSCIFVPKHHTEQNKPSKKPLQLTTALRT